MAKNEERSSILRRSANELLKKIQESGVMKLSETEILKLVHELEVHQVELEMQNEELERLSAEHHEVIQKYTDLYDSASSGYFTFSRDGKILELNLYGAKMLGKDRIALKNSSFGFFLAPYSLPVFNHFLQEVFRKQSGESCELIIALEQQKPAFIQLSGIYVPETDCCNATVMDVTDRKRTEEALQESRRNYQRLVENASLGIFQSTPEGEVISVNPSFATMFGYDSVEDVKKRITNISTQLFSDPNRREEIMQQMEKHPEIKTFESIYLRKDHSTFPGNLSVFPVKDPHGRLIRLEGFIEDITERKRLEKVLAESEEKFRNFFENSVLGKSVTGIDGLLNCNEACSAILGYSREELSRLTWQQITQPDSLENDLKILESLLTTDRSSARWEKKYIHKNGSTVYVDCSTSLQRDQEGKPLYFMTSFMDITRQTEALQALQQSEENLRNAYLYTRSLIETSLDPLIIVDVSGKITDVNNAAEKITGKDRKEMIGTDFADYFTDTGNAKAALLKVFETGTVIDFPLMVALSSGSQTEVICNSTLFKDEKGRIMGVFAALHDITELRKTGEVIRLQNEELQRLIAEKDKFFSIVAHDLRSPFNGLLGFTEVLAEDLNNLTLNEIQNMANLMNKSAANLFHLLTNLLEWSRTQRGLTNFDPRPFLLMPRISECMVSLIEYAAKKGIEISYDIPENTMVFADVDMFDCIIRNLVYNAIKFSLRGGKVLISAALPSENGLQISVRDNGIGMNAEIIDNLFRIGVNTNRKGTEGELSTGLGLNLCKEFVEKHGGKIWVVSEERMGSEFTFTLPLPGN